MYAHKNSGRATAQRQSTDVLLRALAERHPGLEGHLGGVAQLAEAVGRHLGLEGEALDHVRVAAELHDVGKVAIPDAILNKPGPLDDEEWAFMRRHTLIGERIVAAAPALGAVAKLVRASHERWDGAATPTPWRARTSHSAPASSPSATPTTRSSPTAPTAAAAVPPRRWTSCSAARARSSTRRWSRPSPRCSRPRAAWTRAAAA